MKIVAGVAVSALLAFAAHSVESSADAASRTTADTGAALPAAFEPPASKPEPIKVQEPRTPHEWLRAGSFNNAVLVPDSVCEDSAPHDVLIHFHGVPVTVEPIVQRTNLNAVVAIVNLGIGSGAYEKPFQANGSLGTFLDSIESSVSKLCKKSSPGVARVAVSAWSAGYGAVYRILMHDKDRPRLDAVLLADGLHADYVHFHQVNPAQMAGYAEFADQAMRGEKLFAITHSEVVPPGYASTHETADYLIEHAGLERSAPSSPSVRPKMRLLSTADRGDFHVRGFGGGALDDHSQHLYGIGDNLWSLLHDRWSKAR